MTKQKTQVITRMILKTEERLYLRLPFSVEEGVERLDISYEYTRHREVSGGEGIMLRREVNIIDLALENPDLVLVGASGSDRQQIYLHENYATPGYCPQPLKAGAWQLVLGAYLVEEQGCPVRVTITQTLKKPVLLVGECHSHTHHSDGWYSVDEAIARAEQDRLDFLFITDHNSIAPNRLLRSSETLAVLPGMELTYYGGHCNFFGVERPVKTYVANSREEVLAIMREGRQNGALLSINHPEDPGCGWTFGLGEEVPYQLMEIWNGPFTSYNQRAVDTWHRLLAQGRVLPAIGGSDFHHAELFRTYAAPATFLYAASRGKSDILDAMRRGAAFVGMNPAAPRIYLEMAGKRMGEICSDALAELLIRVEDLGQGDEVILFNQDGPVRRWCPGACLRFEVRVKVPDSLFLRLEVHRELQDGLRTMASLSNPIYIRE
ncbi:MAG: CehA/McbA family metallohydrolase [Christensenellales bacterium]|jgi:predicted metal-dependent phosphoesterase TrpH